MIEFPLQFVLHHMSAAWIQKYFSLIKDYIFVWMISLILGLSKYKKRLNPGENPAPEAASPVLNTKIVKIMTKGLKKMREARA